MSSDNRRLIFDGDCAFCSSSVRFGQRWIGRMPPAVPYQREDVVRFGLTEADCAAAVQYVGRNGRVHSAHDALSALLIDAGRGWRLLGAAMRLPGIHWLSGVVYRWVARNRHRLPGGCSACAINAPSEPTEPR
jgi:predicted DCC family thiol-disulfide oxidoreductase YuxK